MAAMPQPPVPPAFKEMPFIEKNPAPFLSAEEKERGYMVFSRAITDIVYPNTKPLASERTSELFGFGTPGEFEPLTFSVYPVCDIKEMTVTISDLKSTGNTSIIPVGDIDVRLLTYWNIRYPSYNQTTMTYRRVPELLEKVTFANIPAGESTRYWLTVKVPESCEPGIYTGKITLKEKGFPGEFVLPVTFRVFGFRLRKDPELHFSAYTSVDIYKKYSKSQSDNDRNLWANIADIELAKMKDYGFDTSPTLRLEYDGKADRLVLPGGGREIDALRKAGLTHLVPVLMDSALRELYTLYTGKSNFKKWKVPVLPDKKFYSHLTELVKKFREECRNKKWPEFIFAPADEVDSQSAEFGAKCCKAIKDAGGRIFITKDPAARIYEYSLYDKYVDFWCSQPFAFSRDKIMKSGKEYWCYPNLISGEIRKPEHMCRAGRMTYGFGLWKSGYSMLIPWAWRWNNKSFFEIDYLRPERSSPNGNKITQDGEFIPAVYWECFREGYDDGRYLYTLEKAIGERVDSTIPECREKVKKARLLLEKISGSFKEQKLYDEENSFESQDFAALRWQMALMIEELLKYPTDKNSSEGSAFSFLSGEAPVKSKPDCSQGTYVMSEIKTIQGWKSVTKEGALSKVFDKERNKEIMLFKIMVDHKQDGEFPGGAYPVGWPRFSLTLGEKTDFSKYQGLLFYIKVHSSRDEVADDYTFLSLDGKDSRNNKIFSGELLGACPENEWIRATFQFPPENTATSADGLKSILQMNFVVPESYYPDGTEISFFVDGPYLCSIARPFVEKVRHPHFILKSGRAELPVKITSKGIVPPGNQSLSLIIVDDAGKTVYKANITVNSADFVYRITLEGFAPGEYNIAIFDGPNAVYSSGIEVVGK